MTLPGRSLPLSPSQAVPGRLEFYRSVLDHLQNASVPFLVGGAVALRHYTGIERDTKDLDLFLHPRDQEAALSCLAKAGLRTQMTAPHWLTKAFGSDSLVDMIFGLANGIGQVDDDWFRHAAPAEILGRRVGIIPVEEMIYSKAFIMERERFDGADINHLLRAAGRRLDWERLVRRFGPHWRVLFSHVVLFGFVYPVERSAVPAAVLKELTGRLLKERDERPAATNPCRGTLLSRQQYVFDLERDQMADARLAPHGNLSPEQANQ